MEREVSRGEGLGVWEEGGNERKCREGSLNGELTKRVIYVHALDCLPCPYQPLCCQMGLCFSSQLNLSINIMFEM